MPYTDSTHLMEEDINHNFDVSVVMPFYKKIKEFRTVFPRNLKYFERNGIEIILALDCPEEKEEVLEFIASYPLVNWIVVVNDNTHPWRNPAKALNVGLRNATKNHILVCSPESEMVTDVIYILRKTFEDYHDLKHYAIGRVCFLDSEHVTPSSFNNFKSIPFGSIMALKEDLYQIGGYDESFCQWGGDDNNLRSRLEMNGVEELYVSEAMMAHRDMDNLHGKIRRSKPFAELPTKALRQYFFPIQIHPNDDFWGTDFSHIVYHWQKRPDWAAALGGFASTRYNEMELANAASFTSVFQILLLVQSFNEEKHVFDFIKNIEPYIDGILLLDDGSEDNTYQSFNSPKLIIKAKKDHKIFNDLANRNALLDMASFIPHQYCLFLDMDERLHGRLDLPPYSDLKHGISYLIPFVHLWDSTEYYNAQYPGSCDGICLRYKLFSNIGHCRINSAKRLHFHQIPCKRHTGLLNTAHIRHYGLITAQMRKAKYNFYISEDSEGCQPSYRHFLANPDTLPVSQLEERCLNLSL